MSMDNGSLRNANLYAYYRSSVAPSFGQNSYDLRSTVVSIFPSYTNARWMGFTVWKVEILEFSSFLIITSTNFLIYLTSWLLSLSACVAQKKNASIFLRSLSSAFRGGNVAMVQGSLRYADIDGYLWLRTTSSSVSRAYFFDFNAILIYPALDVDRYFGFTDRKAIPATIIAGWDD